MIANLFSSRKFVLALVVIVAMVPLVIFKSITPELFVETMKWLVVSLIGAIGLEGAAEKVLLPPPAPRADSMRPPKIPTPVPPVFGGEP